MDVRSPAAEKRRKEERGMAIDRAIVSFYDERENEANKSFGENGTGNSFLRFVCLLFFPVFFLSFAAPFFIPSFVFLLDFFVSSTSPSTSRQTGPDPWPRPSLTRKLNERSLLLGKRKEKKPKNLTFNKERAISIYPRIG